MVVKGDSLLMGFCYEELVAGLEVFGVEAVADDAFGRSFGSGATQILLALPPLPLPNFLDRTPLLFLEFLI